MSLVIRHKRTGAYLQAPGQWTDHFESALQFNSGLKLVDYLERGAMRENADSLEVVVVPRQATPASLTA